MKAVRFRRRGKASDTIGFVSKKIWSREEDETLRRSIEIHGTSSWPLVGSCLINRTGKQCRERWYNHLHPDLKKDDWSEEEDRIIATVQHYLGNQWAKMTAVLPGRTDNAIKNRWHAVERLKRTVTYTDGGVSREVYITPFTLEEMDELHIVIDSEGVCRFDPNFYFQWLQSYNSDVVNRANRSLSLDSSDMSDSADSADTSDTLTTIEMREENRVNVN